MDNNTLWNDLNIFNEEGFSVTSLKYDEYLELLWVGYENGRISSYSPLTGNEQCYSSFCGHKSSVLDMISLPSCIVSVSESAVSVHSSGGIQQHKFAIIEQNEESYQHTCAVSFQPSGGLVHSQSYSNVFVGNSHDYAYVYDLNNTTSPINKYNIHASTICAQASITFIAVGGGDGRIRLLDPSFRSREVQHILEGHTGTVSSLSFHKNGMNILSCGYKSRAINPYDPNSPVTVSTVMYTIHTRLYIYFCCYMCIYVCIVLPRSSSVTL
jgi:WD40 repeat protein